MNTTTVRTRFVLVVAALLAFAVLAATSSAFACVVGTGTSASCSEAALDACLPGGGSFDGNVTFACGGAATIIVTSLNGKTISADTTIDGGGLITLSGGGTRPLFSVNAAVMLALDNVTITAGEGGIARNGGAVFVGGTLTVTNSTFSDNHTSS